MFHELLRLFKLVMIENVCEKTIYFSAMTVLTGIIAKDLGLNRVRWVLTRVELGRLGSSTLCSFFKTFMITKECCVSTYVTMFKSLAITSSLAMLFVKEGMLS